MRKLIYILLLSVIPVSLFAQTDTVVNRQLEAAYVSGYQNTSIVKGNLSEGLKTTVVEMNRFPRLFGQVDPVRFAQSLPGIQTNSLFSYGLNINGCNGSHNLYTFADMPFYMSAKILGLFPALNTNHYPEITFSKMASDCHLGGALAFDIKDEIPDKVKLDASLGMISAQATVAAPINDKWAVIASARTSFLDFIFRNPIAMDGGFGSISPDFRDYNASLIWKPNTRNTLDLHWMLSQDFYDVGYDRYATSLNVQSPQNLAGVRWRHKGESLYANNRFFYLTKGNHSEMVSETVEAIVSSELNEWGWRGDFSMPFQIKADGEFSFYNVRPQYRTIESSFRLVGEAPLQQNAIHSSIGVAKVFELSNLTIKPHFTFSYYDELDYANPYFHFDPQLNVAWNLHKNGSLDFNVGRKHQYISESSMFPGGIPVQFSVALGHLIPPQESIFSDLNYTFVLGDGKWQFSSQLFYKHLTNQIEYYGSLFNMMLSTFGIESSLVNTYGYNYGANCMFARNAGALTGWIAYSFGRAVRHTEDERLPETFPASYERPHELNVVLNYTYRQFEFGSDFVLASGIPYTKIKSLYFISDGILADFDDFNSFRLKPYMKLDLSATYHFKSKERFQHGLNLSVYNAANRGNEIGCRLKIYNDKSFEYKAMKLDFRIMPSISYFIKL